MKSQHRTEPLHRLHRWRLGWILTPSVLAAACSWSAQPAANDLSATESERTDRKRASLKHSDDPTSDSHPSIELGTRLKELETELRKVASKVIGGKCRIEAFYDKKSGLVEVHRILHVTTQPGDPFNEITLDEAHRANLTASVGDDLLFPVFYLPQHANFAREQDSHYGEILRPKKKRFALRRVVGRTVKAAMSPSSR